jgi:hypothetical protein
MGLKLALLWVGLISMMICTALIVRSDSVAPQIEPSERQLRDELDLIYDFSTRIGNLDQRRARQMELVADLWDSETNYVHEGLSYRVEPARVFNVNGQRILSQFVEVRAGGILVFRDYHQTVNKPPLLIVTDEIIGFDEEGTPIRAVEENPIEAQKRILHSAVLATTRNGPHLPDNPGTVSTFFSDTSDGVINAFGSVSWADVQANPDNVGVAATSNLFIGTDTTDGNWAIRLGALSFDTSAIDDGDIVSNVTLSVFSNSDGAGSDGNIELRDLNWPPTLTTSDWVDLTTASNWTNLTLFGSLAHSTWTRSNGSENQIVLDISFVSKSGVDALGALLDIAYGSDVDDVLNYEDIYYADQSGTNLDPKIVVTHEAEDATPTPTPEPTATNTPEPGATPTPTPIPGAETIEATGAIAFLWLFGIIAFIALAVYTRTGFFHLVAAVFALFFALEIQEMMVWIIMGVLIGVLIFLSELIKGSAE